MLVVMFLTKVTGWFLPIFKKVYEKRIFKFDRIKEVIYKRILQEDYDST